MILIMVVAAFWAASATGTRVFVVDDFTTLNAGIAFIGFFLAMIDACRRAIHKDKYDYGQRVPPRELQSAPYAHPFTTTYARP